MDDLSRKFRSIDWKGIQRGARKVQASTASALKDMVMTDLENKTRSATADTSWGASGTDLMSIAQGTYSRDDYALIMSIVWQRLGSSRWRCVYKGLEVLKFLIMHGAGRCSDEARGALGHLQSLQHYRAVTGGKDVGEGVRMRATLVCEMLSDEGVLEQEREKSRQLRAKLSGGFDMRGASGIGGMSSEDYRYGDQHGEYGEGSGASHVTGTASYKGYGDANGGAYDDEPAGNFAKKGEATSTSEKPNIDDLLGGDDDVQPAAANNGPNLFGDGGDDDDDDDDFNPRSDSGQAAGMNGGVDDMFGALALVPSENTTTTPMYAASAQTAGSSAGMRTSELVAALAAQKSAPIPPPAQDVHPAAAGNGVAGDFFPSTNGNAAPGASGNVWDNIDANSAPATTSPAPLKKAPQLKKRADPDPFGGLLDTAKKTGVL